ncbi:MAG: tetratricopeptide repeat protein, partial [Paracoccaceae bacterium]
FADAHAALAHAMAGNGEALARISSGAKGPMACLVRALAGGFGALAAGDWAAAAAHLTGAMTDHARLGGSRAQRDLIEFAMAAALLRMGRAEEARRLLAMRRPVSTPPGAVKGLAEVA